MKSIVLSVLAFAATPSPSHTVEGFVIQESVEVDGAPMGRTATSIALGKIRRDTVKLPILEGSGSAVIMDPTSRTPVVSLFHGPQVWSGIDRQEFDAGNSPGPFVEGIGVSDEDTLVVPAQPFVPTGRTDKIGEWVAKEYVSVASGPGSYETRLWIAPTPSGLPNDAILGIAERVYSRPGNAWDAYFRGMRALGGFPVRTVNRIELNGKMLEIVSTVTSISRRPVSAKAFEVPVTYRQAPERRAR